MDGPWQIGQNGRGICRIAHEAAKVMKLVDSEIELVACGSPIPGCRTFRSGKPVLEHLRRRRRQSRSTSTIGRRATISAPSLALPLEMDRFIKTAVATCDFVKRKAVQETDQPFFRRWNVWYHTLDQDKEIYRDQAWAVAPPLLEDIYTMEDALVVGGMLITLLKNADRVKIACSPSWSTLSPRL